VKEVHSSRGELNALKVLHLSRWFNLKITTFIYWPVEYIPKKLHLLGCSNLKKLLAFVSH
jgi:hypothetical protein